MLFLGCPIWSNKAWVGTLFPEGSKQRDFLTLYSRRLNAVEGNTTFYGVPTPETVARWRAETPPGFKFCLKFPRAITHDHRLRDAEADTSTFLECLSRLDDRAGASLLQLPPSFGSAGVPVLLRYLDQLPPLPGGCAVEVRHPDFFEGPAEATLAEALRERGVARVLYDQRGLRSAEPDDEARAGRRPPSPTCRCALPARPILPLCATSRTRTCPPTGRCWTSGRSTWRAGSTPATMCSSFATTRMTSTRRWWRATFTLV